MLRDLVSASQYLGGKNLEHKRKRVKKNPSAVQVLINETVLY